MSNKSNNSKNNGVEQVQAKLNNKKPRWVCSFHFSLSENKKTIPDQCLGTNVEQLSLCYDIL